MHPVLRWLLLLVPLARLAAAVEPLRTLAEVRALTAEAAADLRPVQLDGTVIYFDPKRPSLILHDGTAGCYISAPGLFPDRSRIRPGARVRISGVTNPEPYFPDVMRAQIDFLADGELPPPRKVGPGELFACTIDSEWVEVEAVVVGVETGGLAFTLVVEIGGAIFKAEVPEQADAAERAAALMQRRVRLRGIVGTIRNSQRQMTGRHFFVPSFDQILPVATHADTAPPPRLRIAELLRSDHGPDSVVRVRGTVTQPSAAGLYLRDDTGSTFVHAAEPHRHPPGSVVEVEGFAAVAPFRPVLRAAHIEPLAQSAPPPPLPFTPARLTALHAEFVTLDCHLLARRDGPHEHILQCRTGDLFFEALLPASATPGSQLRPGDHLRLTGICEVTTTRPMPRVEWADGFRLHLAGPAAMIVLQRAPWWTPERALAALGAALAVLLVAFVWNALLRRRVAAQAAIITRQVGQGVVKDERQRIARELHDTLEQELTGVSMQLGNLAAVLGADTGEARHCLTLARRMLQHCREETRASVSDLRDPSLLERGLPAVLGETLAAAGPAVEFHVTGEPRRLPATTEHHLLRIAREAVGNAVRHAAARRIVASLGYHEGGVSLVVRDDGHGFDAAQAPPLGRFGLVGMRERTNKIRARFTLRSSPGAGTEVRIELPSPPNPQS